MQAREPKIANANRHTDITREIRFTMSVSFRWCWNPNLSGMAATGRSPQSYGDGRQLDARP